MKEADPSSTVYTSQGFDASWLEDPLNYMVKAFAAFLQTLFEQAPKGCFHWTAAPEESEIVITEENPVNVDAIERKPVISLILGAVRFNGMALDDLLTVDATDASERHTDMLPGTMSLNCMSRVPQEARFIAWHCARHIWILRKLFIAESHIHEVGRQINIGSVTPAGALVQGDTEGEWHAAPVSVPFFLQWMDKVTPLSDDWNGRPIHMLRAISMQFQTRMGRAQPSLTTTQNTGRQLWGAQVHNNITPPRIRGRTIPTTPQPGADSVPLAPRFKV